MTYTVVIERSAQKDFRHLVPPWEEAIKKAISGFETNPRPNIVKKLSGAKNDYRVRVGDYRILFTIDDRQKIVVVFRIRHRSEVYR